MNANQQWHVLPQKVIKWMPPPWMLEKGFPSLARGLDQIIFNDLIISKMGETSQQGTLKSVFA